MQDTFRELTGEKCTVLCQYYSHHNNLDVLGENSDCLKMVTYAVDLSDSKETEKWVQNMADDGYEPDHILHAAAEPFSYMYIKEYDWEKLLRQLTVQVNSFGQIMKMFLPKMGKKKYGKVVTILSAYVIGVPPKYMSDYVVTKHALYGLVKSAASECAKKA